MTDITYDIIKSYGQNPKTDIWDWAPEHERMGKGITLTEEVMKLRELLSSVILEPES